MPLIVRAAAGSIAPVPITPAPSTTSAVSTVPVDNTSITLLVANVARLGFVISNPVGGGSANRLFVKYGAGATTTDWTLFLDPGSTLIHPDGATIWVGIVTATLNSAGPRDIQVTELTP